MTVAGLWIVAAAAAFYLDPLGIRRHDATQAICAPAREWKAFGFARSHARIVILGSSRTGWGLDPADLPGPAYNLGLEAANLQEAVDVAMKLIRDGHVEHILLGIDEDDFFAADSGHAFSLDSGIVAAALASLRRETLLHAIGAWRGAHCNLAAYRPGDGFVHALNREFSGFGTLSDRVLNFWANRYARQCAGRDCAAMYQRSLASLRRLVEAAAQTHTRLTLFLNPVPAMHRQLEIQFIPAQRQEQWRRDVAAIAASMSEPVRDFTYYDVGETAEFPIRPGVGDEIPGFLDFSHFTRAAGRDMLRIIESGSPRGAYGAALTPQSVEGLIAHDRAAQAAWVRSHPDEVARIERARRRVAAPATRP